jgi:acetyl esterase/lipase
MAKMPPFEQLIRMEVVYRVPGMADVAVRRDVPYTDLAIESLTLDVYQPPGAPAGSRLPAVLMIHGGPGPRLGAKNMGVYTSYGRLLAASGLVTVTFNHRFLAPERLLDAASDVEAAAAWVLDHAGELSIDGERLAFWAFSGGGPFLSLALRKGGLAARALVAYYAALDLQEKPPGASEALSDETRRDFSPVHHVRGSGGPIPPILVARAGLDQPFLNAGIDRFVQEALAANASLDLFNHPAGRHGFDILDDDARSREIIARTIEFLRLRLSPDAPTSR